MTLRCGSHRRWSRRGDNCKEQIKSVKTQRAKPWEWSDLWAAGKERRKAINWGSRRGSQKLQEGSMGRKNKRNKSGRKNDEHVEKKKINVKEMWKKEEYCRFSSYKDYYIPYRYCTLSHYHNRKNIPPNEKKKEALISYHVCLFYIITEYQLC